MKRPKKRNLTKREWRTIDSWDDQRLHSYISFLASAVHTWQDFLAECETDLAHERQHLEAISAHAGSSVVDQDSSPQSAANLLAACTWEVNNALNEIQIYEIRLAFARLYYGHVLLRQGSGQAGRRQIVEGTRLAANHITLSQSMIFYDSLYSNEFIEDFVTLLSERAQDLKTLKEPRANKELSWKLREVSLDCNSEEAARLRALLPAPRVVRNNYSCCPRTEAA